MKTDEPVRDADDGSLTIEQGGGPPIGTAWTFEVDGDEGWSADLEHAAPLPRIGERIEFIGEDGQQRVFRVTDVIHTLQTSASDRPPVSAERASPNSIVTGGADDRQPRTLRAGLPRVLVAPDGQD
jgi:hypothetical protein